MIKNPLQPFFTKRGHQRLTKLLYGPNKIDTITQKMTKFIQNNEPSETTIQQFITDTTAWIDELPTENEKRYPILETTGSHTDRLHQYEQGIHKMLADLEINYEIVADDKLIDYLAQYFGKELFYFVNFQLVIEFAEFCHSLYDERHDYSEYLQHTTQYLHIQTQKYHEGAKQAKHNALIVTQRIQRKQKNNEFVDKSLKLYQMDKQYIDWLYSEGYYYQKYTMNHLLLNYLVLLPTQL